MLVNKVLLGLLAIAAAPVRAAEHWALIVVGSRGYDNYRHQSDACHSYHVVRRHGIPEENVVLLMYDDVANHKNNPFPGKLFNKPTGKHSAEYAVDVYDGCKVDYRGDDVTPQMFIDVLLGNKTATGGRKVLESGPEDRVFVNFIDHGARGFICFTHGAMLKAKELRNALQTMHADKKYKELVFYVEACESGSMFSNSWLRPLDAFVTTAANGHESSWGTYCPPHDYVNGTELDTCLGDLYSVNWMQDSDLTDLSAETVQQQYDRVKQETTRSHVHEFGTSSIKKEIVGNFQSTYDKQQVDTNDHSVQADKDSVKDPSAVDAHDIDLVIAFYKYLRAPVGKRHDLAKTLIHKVKEREHADAIFGAIAHVVSMSNTATDDIDGYDADEDCEAKVLAAFNASCGGFTAYSLKYAATLSSLCASGLSVDEAIATVKRACTHVASPAHKTASEVFDPAVHDLLHPTH
ncbi:TPA: hypothetical protein N0F65_004406 [Lagenidium giganteum]|uniref:legumain n=1 Tax=Lagenidium giganteum TaxID=4803 RepID=A0AAV2ZJE9_9STRA|nr:TPA: hypothetical protein N0F65_004406 [Lagenidium giganteum]